ncbi:hypothetical protein HYH03_013415 [Edaphochlamys debaryana]|uniref:VLRF1 domain-containing protein n=1 Tax=Edaphochlamys debaryana TaxID=47281 RepID=A0A836BT57_9CHLO|nr:hypothetical protein HYH03_013415 [Edaphochlamys debaryana]|eukprot:KAG2487975.1 hypothetical protein HYH03_013415 [Edaphochlamys debaryana]
MLGPPATTHQHPPAVGPPAQRLPSSLSPMHPAPASTSRLWLRHCPAPPPSSSRPWLSLLPSPCPPTAVPVPTDRRTLSCCAAKRTPATGGALEASDTSSSFEDWLRANPLPGHTVSAAAAPADAPGAGGGGGGGGGRSEQRGKRPRGERGQGSELGSGTAGVEAGGGAGPRDAGEAGVVRWREFGLRELESELTALLAYPRVDWDPQRLAWVAYRLRNAGPGAGPDPGPGTAALGPGGPRLVPALRLMLPRLAPRPEGTPFGDRLRKRSGLGAGGGEGWATGAAWGSAASSRSPTAATEAVGAEGSAGTAQLRAYLRLLRESAEKAERARREAEEGPTVAWLSPGRPSATSEGPTQGPDTGGARAGEKHASLAATAMAAAVAEAEAAVAQVPGGAAGGTVPGPTHGDLDTDLNPDDIDGGWAALEVAADDEELRMLAEAEAGPAEAEAGPAEAGAGPAEAGAGLAEGVAGLAEAEAGLAEAATSAPARARRRRHPPLPPVDAALVLLSADSAALAVWAGGRLAAHRVLTGYTVRHSAGGSQARRDRRGGSGGGRSVGAQLRRSEAARLWGGAAAVLGGWAPLLRGAAVLVRSGNSRAWEQLYAARPPPPLELRDPRWEAARVAVPRPRLRDALALHRRLCTGRLEELGEGAGG